MPSSARTMIPAEDVVGRSVERRHRAVGDWGGGGGDWGGGGGDWGGGGGTGVVAVAMEAVVSGKTGRRSDGPPERAP